MPAPAVIPALIAYVKVVAVKTLVVGIRSPEALPDSAGPLLFSERAAVEGGEDSGQARPGPCLRA